jgi:Flp pilus assembly protein CpaB
MNRLTVVVVAAIVALASGVGLVRYVAGAEDRATATAQTVPVLVAASDVSQGTSFADAWAAGSIVRSEILQGMLPATAITDPVALEGMVADGVLRQGQLVVQGVFVAPDSVGEAALPPTFADTLPDGSVAVSFDATGPGAVSNLISPGDRVNLLVQVPNASELGLPDSGGPAMIHVFQDLRVIAIGGAVAPAPGADVAVANPGAGSYTVAVAPRDAARLLLLTTQYEVFLALIGPGNEPAPQDPVSKVDALPEALTAEEGVAAAGTAAP